MKTPFVSVIIPAYNEESNIGKSLESLKNVDYPKNKLEIIVVDDGSKDKTTAIVKKFKTVKLISLKKNSGVATARNVGIDNAKGNILLFIDADCIVDKKWIKEHVKHYPKYDCVSGGYVPKKGKTIVSKYEYYFAKLLWKEDSVSPCFNNGSYKKKILKKNKFDENIKYCHYEDKDLSLRILAKGYKFYYEPNAKVEHLSEEEEFASVLKKKFKSAANQPIFLKKYFNKRGLIPIFIIPAFIVLTVFLGVYGFLLSFIILLLTPPNVFIIFRMSRLAGLGLFIPFLLLALLFKLLIYLGIDYGVLRLYLGS